MSDKATERTPEEQAALDKDNQRRLAALNEAEEMMRKVQEKGLRVNIDRAWTEYSRTADPLIFEFGGTEYEVPRAMPADFGIFYSEQCLKKVDDILQFEIPEDHLGRFLDLALGEKFAAAVKGSKLDFVFIRLQILRPILMAWGLAVLMADEEKKTATESIPESSPGPGPS